MTIGQTGKGKDWTDKVNDKLTRGKQYLKLHYKVHISVEMHVVYVEIKCGNLIYYIFRLFHSVFEVSVHIIDT